jgi:hypothetical protein
MVSDRGDWGLFTIWTGSFWIKIIFPFPLSPTKCISDYFDIKGCGANNEAMTHRSSLRQWRCGLNPQCESWTCGFLFLFWPRLLLRFEHNVRLLIDALQVGWSCLIRIAFCQTNRLPYSFCWRARKRKYVSQWQRACSKWKWTSIVTVPNLPNSCKILNPPYFSLPTTFKDNLNTTFGAGAGHHLYCPSHGYRRLVSRRHQPAHRSQTSPGSAAARVRPTNCSGILSV